MGNTRKGKIPRTILKINQSSAMPTGVGDHGSPIYSVIRERN